MIEHLLSFVRLGKAQHQNLPKTSLSISKSAIRPYHQLWQGAAGALLVSLVAITPAQAQQPNQNQPQKLRVATRIVKPFVFEENGKLVGFSVDLWESIRNQANIESEFVVQPTVADLLSTVKSKKADVGIAAISITAERDRQFDFSYPMFDSGLQILVMSQPSSNDIVSNLISGIFSITFLQLTGIILLFVLIPAHIIWFFEYRHREGICAEQPYYPGVFKAYWWALATLATQADEMPKSLAGRVVAVIWMFASVLFVAYFTATVTASLTVQQLRTDIKGPDDLPGKRVVSVAGSTSVEFLREKQIKVVEVTQVEQAYEALLQGQADAVVYDAPVLLYFASHEGKGKVQVVGSVFRNEGYGIAFPESSIYRRPINRVLLTLKENGTYQALYQKWFGSN